MNIINLPLQIEDISDLRIGDIIYLSGTIVTGRDEVHHRIIEEGQPSPIDLKGMAIYHAGPIVKEKNSNPESSTVDSVNNSMFTDNCYLLPVNCSLVSIGPTSSIRMEKWAADFIKKTGIKIMIGKGGMGEKTAAACKEECAIHCVYPGGCAVLGATQIEKIENVFWYDLGMAECLWVMKSKQFGPLIVSIDTQGNNLFAENAKYFHLQK